MPDVDPAIAAQLQTQLRDELTACWDAQQAAMTGADAGALGELLAPGFVLVHMTGYRQDRDEWLADVASGAMTYHRIDTVDAMATGTGTEPVLTVRTHTAATIWGAHGTWPLQLAITFTRAGDGWVQTGTVASTWTTQ